MNIFANKLKKFEPTTKFDRMVEGVGSIVNNTLVGASGLTSLAISTESLRDDQIRMFENTTEGLRTSLEALAGTMNLSVEDYQLTAGVVAGVIAADPQKFLGNKHDVMISTEGMHVVQSTSGDAFETRPLALEAYDDRDNKNAAMFSIAYNMQAARQDEFGETLFPTVVLAPDQVGISITVRLMQVYNDLYRQISGDLDQYRKKNIIRAVADPTILKSESTRIIPVHRVESAAKFVDVALLAPRTVTLEGESILTSSLATGVPVSLLGLSQTDTLLQSGAMDVTDSIERAIRLHYLVIKAGDDILKVDVSNLPLSEFTYATQGNFRKMALNFDTTSVLINDKTKQADGSALVDLLPIVTGDYTVRLEIAATGSVNIETGQTEVYGNKVRVYTVQDTAMELLDPTAAPANAIVALFDDAEIIGYEVIAYRSNLNRRQRGQLIDTTFESQAYNVPYFAPFTAIHPVTLDGQTDASDLQALVTATRVLTSNKAVTALIEAAQGLHEYVVAEDYVGLAPDILGVGRFYVHPSYFEEAVNMTDIVDSMASKDRAEDIQMALVNKIRDYVYRMYRDSEYQAAADALSGGTAPTPEVIIATDPVIGRWLMVTGELRTLGGEFNTRIVTSLDRRVAGKIFVTFGVFDETRNSQVNPLSFGNMLWSPEVTVVLPISRNGQISKELCVTPRFRHIVNLPIMTALTITGLPNTVSKMPIHFKEV